MSVYESKEVLDQYLLFHYGAKEQILPYDFGPHNALEFPAKVVDDFIDSSRLLGLTRALDLGCSVGRSSFELSKYCDEVLGIDFSHAFIKAANSIRDNSSLEIEVIREGFAFENVEVRLPQNVKSERVRFEQGDAQNLSQEIGLFDVVLMSNLIDRLPRPKACLEEIHNFIKPKGQLIIASPYTWLSEYTENKYWLAGATKEASKDNTLAALQQVLAGNFSLDKVGDLPFLIREHARKYQWSVSQVGCWIRA